MFYTHVVLAVYKLSDVKQIWKVLTGVGGAWFVVSLALIVLLGVALCRKKKDASQRTISREPLLTTTPPTTSVSRQRG